MSVIWAVRHPNFSTAHIRISDLSGAFCIFTHRPYSHLRSERCILHFYPPPRFVFSFWAVLTAFFTSSPAPSTCRNRHALTARNCGATNHTAQQSPAKSPQVASHRHVARSSESSAEPRVWASHRKATAKQPTHAEPRVWASHRKATTKQPTHAEPRVWASRRKATAKQPTSAEP
jgi:hypothetical protein